MDKILYIVRGLPGSGKTTLAKTLTEHNVAADDYFKHEHGGVFRREYLGHAHDFCLAIVAEFMWQNCDKIAVHNTFTQHWEFAPYEELARINGYTVFHIIVENRHGNSSVHNVPDETISKMRNRFEVRI